MKVALVYDRVNKWGGAERVLLALNELFPDAPLYTSVYSPKGAKWAKAFPKVIPSFLQKIPFAKKRHEMLGTFTPIAFETFDFSPYDLVISVTSEAAKGIITRPGTKHICYCLTPTRYLWSAHDTYFENPLLYFFSRPAVAYLRKWDKIAAMRPDKLVAISGAVRERIKKYYGRDSVVIHPPVDVESFSSDEKEVKESHFLVVSRLVKYKRVDLAIKAANKLEKRLVVVGKGGEEGRLKRLAGDTIHFAGELTDEELANYYRKALGVIFPQEEDFGIVAVEAQSAGTPVIAYKKGGALDTVVHEETGIFFQKQSERHLVEALNSFEEMSFSKDKLVKSARSFSKEKFKEKFKNLVEKELNE